MSYRFAARWPWLRSIRVRILAVVTGLLLISLIVEALVLRAVLFDRLDDEVGVDLDQEVEEFRLLSGGNDPNTGEPFDGDLRAIFDVYFDREVPGEGEALLSFIDGRLYEDRRSQDAATVQQLEPVIAYWLSLEEDERGTIDTVLGEARYVALVLEGDGDDGLFVVANFPAFERGEIDDAIRTQVVIQFVTLVVVLLLGLALAGRILRPLRSLATTARRITDTDLSERIPVTGRDEASEIADEFNDMITRLERTFVTQRRFLDDSAHELRTPLAVIRGHVELLDLDADAEDRRETVELVVDEIDRMNGIVDDLFLLARAEQPGFLTREPFDLSEVITEVHRKATALADRDWVLEAPAPGVVTADRHRVTQALLQLADNAVGFTSAGDTIRIGARVRGGQAIMWVHDSGPGVRPEDAERIFERFRRGAPARGQPTGGGLGLSIVQAIAEAHGGRATLVPTDEGARFEVSIPATMDDHEHWAD